MSKQFDWQKFHQDLDYALTSWLIDDTNASIHGEFIDFLEFSNRTQLNERAKALRDPKNWHEPSSIEKAPSNSDGA